MKPLAHPSDKPSQAVHGSYASYITGFVLSIILTLLAFGLVKRHVNSGHLIYSHRALLIGLAWLALTQLFVQVVAFLHLGRGRNGRSNLLVFSFMLIVVFIIVGGSLWIMHNLNYRMTPQQQSDYLKNQESGGI